MNPFTYCYDEVTHIKSDQASLYYFNLELLVPARCNPKPESRAHKRFYSTIIKLYDGEKKVGIS
jgi:hypothetical protein